MIIFMQMRDMAAKFAGGGGMPDMSELMNDPMMADMARKMQNGGGAPPQ